MIIDKTTQERIMLAACTLLENADYNKEQAMQNMRIQLEENGFKRKEEVAAFYSKVMDHIIEHNHISGTANR